MESCLEIDRKTRSMIVTACLSPLFFYIKMLCFTGYGVLILSIVQILAGTAALILFLSRKRRAGQTKYRCFWMLMSFCTLGSVFFAFLGRHGFFFWLLACICLLIQLLFPAFHLILETLKRKRFFMNGLLCIYVFSLVLGSTVLFLAKDSPLEFFPIAALTGILLELFLSRSAPDRADH